MLEVEKRFAGVAVGREFSPPCPLKQGKQTSIFCVPANPPLEQIRACAKMKSQLYLADYLT